MRLIRWILRRLGMNVQACDMCDGTFWHSDLCPISGDWWLCDKCLDKYMSDDQHAIDSGNMMDM